MKSLALCKTLNLERSTPNAQSVCRGILLLFLLVPVFCPPSLLHAQVGSDNPTGVAGIFNGNTLEYDPYTGNAGPRSTVDISIAGAVSPLALVRTYNSRDGIGIHFGYSGWRHSYEWSIDPSGTVPYTDFPPAAYVVNFPDGRREIFKFVDWDCGGNPYTCYFRVQGYIANVEHSSAGLRERFVQIEPQNNNLRGYLILSDGSKVEFLATRHPTQGGYYYTYQAQAIIDSHGLRTSFSYSQSRLYRVTEPAGRYIQFNYRPNGSQVIASVSGSDGRTVQYNYGNISPGGTTYLALLSVTYYSQSQWTSHYIYRKPNIAPDGGVPLLLAADEPLYPGVMKRVAYQYKTGTNPDGSQAAYGQIYRVRYYAGYTADPNPDPNTGGNGVPVSTLDVTARNIRTETRGDSKWRKFTYGDPDSNERAHLLSSTDFLNHVSASQTYDDKMYINSVTDRNGHKTEYTLDPLTGNVTQVKFPAIAVPSPAPSGIINYTYGWAQCQDPNNHDDRNPYFLCTATDEAGHVTNYLRDSPNHRLTEIDYPDGGSETFTNYDPFNQARSHLMTTGGTETFTFDPSNGRKLTYRNPDNPTGNPTASYGYDNRGRVSGITDVLNHTTNVTYDERGQLTITTLPPDDNNQRYTIINAYNPDGTLQNRTDELGHMTKYEYDDYRRLRKVTPPVRGYSDTNEHPTQYFYDANGTGDDYRYTDSNITWVKLPSGKKTKTVYDDNRRKQSVTVAYGTADAATTSYGYDPVGNVLSVTNPLNHNNVSTLYDERDRPYSVSVGGQTTAFTYDPYGRQKTIQRPNGQVITNFSFDNMNRVTQRDATNAGSSKFSYHPGSGLLFTVQDPRLVALGRDPDPWAGYVYTYVYDGMGRKSVVGYPPDADGYRSFEAYTYDGSGRLHTYENRNGKTQTFTYDALNRLSYFIWDDINPNTPRVDFGYDAGSRLTSVTNAIATVSRGYFNDNMLRTETETATGGTARTVNYTYDPDGNRATLGMPGYSFTYDYTGRNQLLDIKQNGTTLASYVYDLRGNITSRTLNNNTHSDYIPDSRDRVTWITHSLNGTTRTLNYGYYDDSNNRKYTRRLYANQDVGEVYGYDKADQVTAVLLDVAHPDTTPVGDPTIAYDVSGNRTVFSPYDWVEGYFTNDLNQYTMRLVSGLEAPRPSPTPRPRPTPLPRPPGEQSAEYDDTGNMTAGLDRSTYEYDAQNRLTSATKDGVTMTFKYDGLNRQVTRTVGGVTTFGVWDGWDLVQEYHSQGVVDASYLYGATGLVKNLTTNRYYYQDGSGSTSHLADSTGHLLEWYWYDLQGLPCILDANDIQRTASAYGVRHLFTGQQWYSDIGLYDLRNRFYSPDIGRFLQPDPIGFDGDATNLYRYCGNNPVTRSDPLGLLPPHPAEKGGAWMADALDFGYHGGDGTAGVSFGLMGFDWSGNELGMLQTEQYYASAPYGTTYAQAMAINGWGSVGGIIFPQQIPKARDARTGLYANGSRTGAVTLGGPIGGLIGGVADLIGKIWALPNTVIGLAAEVVLAPFAIANGGGFQIGNNAIQLVNVPFGGPGAVTLGNAQIYFNGGPGDNGAYNQNGAYSGPHEQGHTYQYQILGPFFLPIYFLSGHPFTLSNPFEAGAQQYALTHPPGG